MTNILMAEDHSIVREGLKQLFALTKDITVVAEAANGSQVLERLRQPNIDVVLLDMTMPGISGINLIARMRNQKPETPILVLSMHNEPQIARRAIIAGAMGYLTKDSEPEILLLAIRKIAGGESFIDPILAEKMLFASNDHNHAALHEKLSEREYEILLLLAQGKKVNEIANKLVISNKTVSTHKKRLMQKMNFASDADLVRYVIANDIVV